MAVGLVNDVFAKFVVARGETAEVVVAPFDGLSVVRMFTGC